MQSRLVGAAFAACCLGLSAPAHAAGFYFGDNGTKAMMLGGAFVAQADDLTAIDYNPAGLTQLDGFSFLVDSALINHAVTFHRQDTGFDPNNPSALAKPVSNSGGLFWLPFFGVGYGLKFKNDMRLSIALGVYGPPADGRYNYPVPDYTKDATTGRYLSNPGKEAAQRYGLVHSNLVVAYPTLAVAFSPHRIIQAGASLQLVYSSFDFGQTVYSGLSTPTSMSREDPIFDTTAGALLYGGLKVTGIFGVTVRPIESLSIGFSLRPNIPITACGDINFKLGEAATGLGATVTGAADPTDTCYDAKNPSATRGRLLVELPLEIRAGASFKPFSLLRVNADFVYQGWNSIQDLGVTPQGVTLTLGGGTPQAVGTISVPKLWMPSYSGRVGVSVYALKMDWFALTLHAGFMYETASARDEYANIDFLHFNRAFITGGATVGLGPIDVVLGVMGTPDQTHVVQNSELRAGSTDPLVPGAVVGNGIYTSGGWSLMGGIRGHFGESRSTKFPGAAPAPAPAPAPAQSAPPSEVAPAAETPKI